MNTPRPQGTSEFVTYAVTLPVDAPDQLRALSGLASAFGWEVQEHIPVAEANASRPPAWEITDRRFYQASTDLWGSVTYGQTVVHEFAVQRAGLNRAYSVMSLEFDADKIVCGLAPINDQGQHVVAERSTAPEELANLEAKVHTLWEDRDFPFALEIEKDVDGTRLGMLHWRLLPGLITKERLAHHAQSRNYPNHKLHGALGKSLDVINVVAGLTPPAETASEIETDFINYEEFVHLLKASKLTSFAKQEIRRKLAHGIAAQFRSGRPQLFGEIILEGAVELRADAPTYEKIALSSLAALAETFTKPDPRRFLRSLG